MEAIELVDKLNGLKISQISDWEESIPEDIWNEYFEGKFKVLQDDLNVCTHRWYETSITVIEIENMGIIGINSVTNVFSEQMTFSDCGETLKFFEMKEVQTISYVVKK